MASPFIIIKTGSTYPDIAAHLGDFEDWIIDAMEIARDAVEIINVQAGAPLPVLDDPRAVVITGSHSMVTDREDWSERTARWVRDAVAADWPVLGICYGHQLLAHACGGVVGPGVEIGCAEATRTQASVDDPLLGGLPAHFITMNGHQQAVQQLPQTATLLATTARDPHHAYRIGRRAWGVQWHPELTVEILETYIRNHREALDVQGLDVHAVRAALVDTPVARTILPRFAALVRTELAAHTGTLAESKQIHADVD